MGLQALRPSAPYAEQLAKKPLSCYPVVRHQVYHGAPRRLGTKHVVQGRKNKRKESNRQRSTGNEWWIADPEPEWEPTPPSRSPGGPGSTSMQGKPSPRAQVQNEDEDEEDGRGWWELPRGGQGPSYGTEPLEPWQEEKLMVAYAVGKRKISMQDLAADVGLDRSEVLLWMKTFAAWPAQEQQQLMAPLLPQVEAWRRQQQLQHARQQQQQQQGVLIQEQQQAVAVVRQVGAAVAGREVPSLPSRQQQLLHQRRLSGELRRSLEGVYCNTPYPPREVVSGLYDLHRLPRDYVLAWFAARRREDGLPDNPRDLKRAAAAAAAATAAGMGSSSSSQQVVDAAGLQALLSGASVRMSNATAAAAGMGGAAVGPGGAPPAMQQMLSSRELIALRSSLPSPRKFKGAKLQEQLGVKQRGPEEQEVPLAEAGSRSTPGGMPALEIAGITFLRRDGRAAWKGRWRTRRSKEGVPAQRLDFQKWLLTNQKRAAAEARQQAQ